MTHQKYVCVDLDGTIAHYEGWVGETHFGEPTSGVQAALERVRAAGWKIIIHTTRGNRELIRAYLEENAVPFDHINENPDQPPDARGGKPSPKSTWMIAAFNSMVTGPRRLMRF